MLVEWAAVLAVVALVLWILNKPFSPPAASRAKLRKQSHIVQTHTLNEGSVYRSLDVKDGPLLSEPFPGVRTLHDIFL
jgi:hypothetical protein